MKERTATDAGYWIPAVTLAERLAIRFHLLYEQLAPSFGYETRPASAKPWAEVPEQNRRLMVAVCEAILAERDAIGF
jgi:hypothetical protein